MEGCHNERDEFSIQERHLGTIIVIQRKRKKATDCKWVFAKRQESLDGDIVRYKGRLTAKGYTRSEKALTTVRYSHQL